MGRISKHKSAKINRRRGITIMRQSMFSQMPILPMPTQNSTSQTTQSSNLTNNSQLDSTSNIQTSSGADGSERRQHTYSKKVPTVSPKQLNDATTPRTGRFRQAANKRSKGKRLDFSSESENDLRDIADADSGNDEDLWAILKEPEAKATNETEGALKGRRIISMDSINSIIRLSVQHSKNCARPSLSVTKEQRKGMHSNLLVTCGSCKDVFYINTDEGQNTVKANEAAVWAVNSSGIGYTAFDLALTALEIPVLALATFSKHENVFMADMEKAARMQLIENGKKEKEMAMALNQICSDGIPWTTVYGDGQWSKRSYNNRGVAMSGSAVIIGALSGLVLDIGVRNRFCVLCQKTDPAPHICYKNWDKGAPEMEASIIGEFFANSVEKHGLRYKKFVGDGDSSVFNAIQHVYANGDSPYEEVEKINCTNHAIRRLNTNVLGLLGQTSYDQLSRKKIEEKWTNFGRYCYYVIEHNRNNQPNTNASTLKKDIMSVLPHTFGCHKDCNPDICKNGEMTIPKKYQKDDDPKDTMIPNAKQSVDYAAKMKERDPSLYKKLEEYFQRLANHSNSLLLGLTNNIAECFQAQVNKFAQGRRINHIQRGKYNLKVNSALFGFQFGSGWSSEAFKNIKGRNAQEVWQKRFNKGLRKRELAKASNRVSRKRNWAVISKSRKDKFLSRRPALGNPHYGNNAQDADVPEEELKVRITSLIESLTIKTKEEQWQIHLNTIGQFENQIYKERRKQMLTASNAGEILGKQDKTSNVALLDKLLDPPDISKKPAIVWGHNNESKAIKLYEKQTGVKVEKAGMFVSLEFGGIGASPDGLVGEFGLIEVKCPYIERFGEPKDTVERKTFPVNFNEKKQAFMLSQTSNYYNQVVTQLHVCDRDWCDFVIWTQGPLKPVAGTSSSTVITTSKEFEIPDGKLLVIRINRSDDTQKRWTSIIDKLKKFYMEDFAPEIVDSRYQRNMGYRQPDYRLRAINEEAEKQTNKFLNSAAIIATNNKKEKKKPEPKPKAAKTSLEEQPTTESDD